MAAAGIVHKPGMAAEVLKELAPFLADEGIDLSEPVDVDLDTLNAALSRATDRYNQGLATPAASGKVRAGSKAGKKGKTPRNTTRTSSRQGGGAGLRRAVDPVLRDFTAWLEGREVIAAPSVEAETQMFDVLLTLAREAGIDPVDPSSMGDWIAALRVLDNDEAPGVYEAALATLDEYVHFRLEAAGGRPTMSAGATGWKKAHDEVNAAVSEYLGEDGEESPLAGVIDAAAAIDPEIRRAAFAQTRVVAMIPRFLEWLGKGRQTSPSQAIRRADIAETAAMLGVRAVGVNKLPPIEIDGPTLFDEAPPETEAEIHALSMQDVPQLAAWWQALRVAKVIETTATRVRPGPEAARWLSEDLPPLDPAETVVGIALAEILIHNLWGPGYFEPQVVALTLTRLLEAVAPGNEWPASDGAGLEALLEHRVLRQLRQLEQLGMGEVTENGGFSVPPALRGAVAKGIISAAAVIERMTDDEDAEDEDE